jgi:hypothetical protein
MRRAVLCIFALAAVLFVGQSGPTAAQGRQVGQSPVHVGEPGSLHNADYYRSARIYRVWYLRHNKYTGKWWWEIYTTTNNQDRAQRIVNTLEQIGYQAYWD